MAQQRVRLGWIGTGRFSRSKLLPEFKKIPGVELTVVGNSSLESSQRAAQELGFERAVGNWREVIEASDIDAIVIGTTPPMHKELTIAALEADRPVLTLNAIAPTLDEAKDMAGKAAEKPHLVNMVYPGQFYLQEDAKMRALLQEGFVGEPRQVNCYWFSGFFGLGTQYEVAIRWFGEHKRVLAHRRIFEGDPPDTMGRQPSRREVNFVLAELENGLNVSYQHNSLIPGEMRFEVYGSEGRLVHYSEPHDGAHIWGAKRGEGELQAVEMASRELGPVNIEAEFIAAVRKEPIASPAVGSFADGARMMEFVQSWRESTEKGAWVDLPARTH